MLTIFEQKDYEFPDFRAGCLLSKVTLCKLFPGDLLFSYPFMKVDQRPQNAFHFSWVPISHLAMYLRVWVYNAHTYTQTDTASNDVFITVGMQDRSMLHGDSLISKRQHNLSYNDPKNMNDWIFGRTSCFTKRKKSYLLFSTSEMFNPLYIKKG